MRIGCQVGQVVQRDSIDFLVGSPEECVVQIAACHEMGFTDVALRLFYPEMSQVEVLEHIDRVGREVIPALHAL